MSLRDPRQMILDDMRRAITRLDFQLDASGLDEPDENQISLDIETLKELFNKFLVDSGMHGI